VFCFVVCVSVCVGDRGGGSVCVGGWCGGGGRGVDGREREREREVESRGTTNMMNERNTDVCNLPSIDLQLIH
jgi:hypothetical protein